MKSEKKKKKKKGKNRTATLGEKKNDMYLEILEAEPIKQMEMKEKKKRVPQTNEKISRNQALQQTCHQKDERSPCKIHC